jgi:polysaccharide export outer membrane protein
MKLLTRSLTSDGNRLKRMAIVKKGIASCLLTFFLGFGVVCVRAQEQSATPSTPQTSAATVTGGVARANPAPATEQYRIGPRDVLSIRVTAGRPVPELSMDSVEVSECGLIPLPSVQQEEQNEIRAAGLTRAELAEQLRLFYTKYKRNPQVVVTIKEYNSQPVAINGAVVKAGQFQLRRPVRLLELLQFYAGGPTERAGGSIQIARLANFNPCEGNTNVSTDTVSFQLLKLSDTLAGNDQANPYLQPGDVITLPDAKEAYVVGNVLRPGPVILKEDKITVSQAIAMVGGTMPDTKQDKVRIIRQETTGGAKKEIFVDLKAIDRRQAPDLALLPNDIIDVPASGGKRLLRSLIGTIAPSVGQLPVRIIP